MHLPLHIFEPRYRAMISETMARDQRIGMIQPTGDEEEMPLFNVGCIGRVAEVEALQNGRYNIILVGESRFQLIREHDVSTAFRQVEAEPMSEAQDDPGILASSERAALEIEARIYAEKMGYKVEWDAVNKLDDETLVNAIAQIAPFDPAAKQAILETDLLTDRTEIIIQLMQFYGRGDGENKATLQ